GLLRALSGREPDREAMSYALLCADRLVLMLAHVRAAEARCAHASTSPRHRRLADRFVHRTLPLLRMHGEIVRGGDRDTLEALRAWRGVRGAEGPHQSPAAGAPDGSAG